MGLLNEAVLVRVQDAPLSLERLLVNTQHPDCGALAIFAGTVRNHHEGLAVSALEYTAHAALADRIIAAIEIETQAVFSVPVCRVQHRVGRLAIGDLAILVVVRAAHRAEAFEALRHAVDRTKHSAPIWKEEFYPDGSSCFVPGRCIAPDSPITDTAYVDA